MTYAEWLLAVDELLEARTGLGHRDLVDWLWADAYEDGFAPKDAVDSFMEELEEDI